MTQDRTSKPGVHPERDGIDAPRTGRVLIVDDEPGMLRAAERILTSAWTVSTASRPSEALAALASADPDLVICDIRMPEMDGFDLVAAMRRNKPGIDVIFMTGSSTEPDAALVRAIKSQAFYFVKKHFDRQVLLTLVDRCIELRRLRQAQREHTARLERELGDARVFQRAMLAPERAEFGRLRVSARCEPCRELGGDLYDFTQLPGGGLAFIIADACGHGATAALLTAVVKAAFRAGAEDGFDPEAIAERLAGAIRQFGTGRFVTAICARVDPSRGLLEYVNAGHPPAMLANPHADGSVAIHELEPTAPMVCAEFDPGSWRAARTRVLDGARLIACTDGLGEALGLGPAALSEHLRQQAQGPGSAEQLVEALLARARDALQAHPAPDDITVIAVAW